MRILITGASGFVGSHLLAHLRQTIADPDLHGTTLSGQTEHLDDDVTAHPELKLARWAARELTPAERRATTMYTSTEPCPMCAAGVAYADLGGVVYSVSGARLGEIRDGPEGIPCGEVFDRLGRDIPVHGPVLADEGEAVHREFGAVGDE